jgi:hypothetical protein
MEKKLNKLFLLILLFNNCYSFSQNSATNSGGQVEQIQPSIIVIPYAKENEDIRVLLQDDKKGFYRRTAISVVNEAFNSRGFTTEGFEAELAKANSANLFNNNVKRSQKEIIAQNSGADIYVETDIEVFSSGNGTEVKLILRAFETATGRALSDKQSSSDKFYTDDITKLTIKALDKVKEDFLTTIQTKFTDIVNNGRSIEVFFNVDKNSKMSYDKEVGTDGDLLSEVIMEWMKLNAYKNYAKKKHSLALEIVYSDVRIPLKDQTTGLNFEIEEFGKLLRKFLRSKYQLVFDITYPPGQMVITLK